MQDKVDEQIKREARRQRIIERVVETADRILCDEFGANLPELRMVTMEVATKFMEKALLPLRNDVLKQDMGLMGVPEEEKSKPPVIKMDGREIGKTAPTHLTPYDQAISGKKMVYDPPEGWRYGFPKAYDPKPGESLIDTLIRDGYPEEAARNLGMHCRFWEAA